MPYDPPRVGKDERLVRSCYEVISLLLFLLLEGCHETFLISSWVLLRHGTFCLPPLPRPRNTAAECKKYLTPIENWNLGDGVSHHSCWGHLVPFVSGSCFLVCDTELLGSCTFGLLFFFFTFHVSVKNQKVAHSIFTCQISQNLALVLIFPVYGWEFCPSIPQEGNKPP